MPDGRDAPLIKVHGRIGDLPDIAWDACAGGANPFVSHAFLSALEDSGAVVPEAGWIPHHLTVEDARGRVVGCAPAYLKVHSYGEFVFDWAWADAYGRAGLPYYPKLLCAVPFTPATGPRLMVRPEAPPDTADLLAAGLRRLAEARNLSSAHVNFVGETDRRRLAGLGFQSRFDVQYHWDNPGYPSFDDFLGALASRKRKAIRKERREVADSGIDVRVLTGADILEAHWDAFNRFYRATSDKKWGPAYLTRDFFSLLGERMGDRVVLVMAFRAGRPVAGALNLRGGDTLYGRNWGCLDDARFLHFEVCYYKAIEYAIAHGLRRVEAGAQGRHKIQRGYLPSLTRSVHWVAHPGFRDAIGRYLEQERTVVEAQMAELMAQSPYRRT